MSVEDRGRKSIAELSVVPVSADVISAVRRAEPPADLTPEQAGEWRDVVNRLPAEWFPRETHGMLAQYCRHVVNARRVAALIEQAVGNSEFDVQDYDRLLKMQEREGRALSSLATRMRISQQGTIDKKKSKPGVPLKKIWEDY